MEENNPPDETSSASPMKMKDENAMEPSVTLSMAHCDKLTMAFLGLASQWSSAVLFAVDVASWKKEGLPWNTEMMDYKARPVTEWAEDVQVMGQAGTRMFAQTYNSRSHLHAKVYYINAKSGVPIALGVELPYTNFDESRDFSTALRQAMEVHIEFDCEVTRNTKLGVKEERLRVTESGQPTLLAVLSALLAEDMTSADQRDQINSLVFAFLQNEISLPRLYSHLAQVVGYTTLKGVVTEVGQQSASVSGYGEILLPNTQPQPQEKEIAKVVTNPVTAGEMGLRSSTSFPTPKYFFKTNAELTRFFEKNPLTPTYLAEMSQTYKYPFWVELPEGFSCKPSRVGHHSLENNGLWLMVGGTMADPSFSFNEDSNTGSDLINGWTVLTIVNQLDFKHESRPIHGTAPTATLGTTALLTGDLPGANLKSECIVVFGGLHHFKGITEALLKGPATIEGRNCFSSDLSFLDLEACRWHQILTTKAGPWPSPRAFACAELLLRESVDGSECEVVGLFVLGGLGQSSGTLCVYKDLWILDLNTCTWSQLDVTGLTSGFFGASIALAGFNQFLISGGWKFQNGPSVLKSDLISIKLVENGPQGWTVCCHQVQVEAGNNEQGLTRALHYSLVLEVQQTSIKPIQLGMSVAPFEHKAMLLLYGGAPALLPATEAGTTRQQGTETISLLNIHITNEEIKNAEFVSTKAPQLRPFSNKQLNPAKRLFESANFFTCYSPLPSTRPKPGLPCLFIHGGVPLTKKPPSNPTDFDQSWIISLIPVDPFGISWFQQPPEDPRASQESMKQPPSSVSMMLENQPTSVSQPNNEVAKLFTEHLRHSAAWLSGVNFCPGIYQIFGAMITWPFAAIGNLVENSTVLSARSSKVSVDFGICASDGSMFMTVADDGRGLPFTTFNRALKRFGTWDGPMERRDTTRNRPTLQYGIGVKMAMGRLSHSCILISRTKGTIGLALISEKLLFHIESQTISCPTCFWRLPSKETVYPEAEHWKNQQKIQQFSPFDSAGALAEQINIIGPKPGTRFIFFDSRDTFPNRIKIDPNTGFGKLNWLSSELISLERKCALEDLKDLKPGEFNTLPPSLSCRQSSECGIAVGSANSHSFLITGTDDRLPKIFPFWHTVEDALDFSLATYLYWCMLFNPTEVWHSGVLLSPNLNRLVISESTDAIRPCDEPIVDGSKTPTDNPFKNSLYRHLKSTLHGMVELEYLFVPTDAQSETCGLLGFINPLDTLVEDSMDDSDHKRPHEAGILLYYRERLIKRLFVPFPASPGILDRFSRGKYPRSHFNGNPVFMFPCTGVINVPDWLFPNPSRDDFVANKSPTYDQFINKNADARKDFILARAKLFLEEAGRSRPLSPLLHMALLKPHKPTDSDTVVLMDDEQEAVPTSPPLVGGNISSEF